MILLLCTYPSDVHDQNRFEPGQQSVEYTYVVLYVLIGRVSTKSIINLDLASAKKTDN